MKKTLILSLALVGAFSAAQASACTTSNSAYSDRNANTKRVMTAKNTPAPAPVRDAKAAARSA